VNAFPYLKNVAVFLEHLKNEWTKINQADDKKDTVRLRFTEAETNMMGKTGLIDQLKRKGEVWQIMKSMLEKSKKIIEYQNLVAFNKSSIEKDLKDLVPLLA